MKLPAAKGYSIWLLFDYDTEHYLQKIIDQFSLLLNSQRFIPHITLIAGLDNYEVELISEFEILFSNTNSFNLRCKRINCSDEFYRSLFIEIEKDDFLKDLYNQTKRKFKVNTNFNEYKPHISLLYSNAKKEMKEKLIAEYLKDIPRFVDVTRIGLVKTKGAPQKWKLLKIIELKNN